MKIVSSSIVALKPVERADIDCKACVDAVTANPLIVRSLLEPEEACHFA